MTPPENEVLISIRPSFANAIFQGSKTVEIRRRIPAIEPGARLWIYVTKPIGEVRGVARVAGIVEGDADAVWRACGLRTGLTRSDFDDYLRGSAKAFGILLKDVKIGQPISMVVLKEIRENFHPPQVITRLTIAESLLFQRHFFPV